MKLSICMPTYNFGRFIGQTLQSIVPQLTPEVEIVVFDGGSTDDTAQVVARFQQDTPAIRYIKQAQRGGIDRDMASTVAHAKGRYCWLFSSDDIMRPRALQRALQEIESGVDVYLGGLTLCDFEMHPIGEHEIHRARPGSVFQLSDPVQRKRYFRLAVTTPAFFSFMGSILVRRERWASGTLDEEFVGSCWAHAVRMLRLVPTGLTVKFLGDPLLLKRGGNDSFMDRGLVHRYAIAIDGYQRIASAVFGEDSYEARQIRRVLVNEFPPRAFFFAKVLCRRKSQRQEEQELDRLVRAAYRDCTTRNLTNRCIYAATPVWAYEAARAVYKKARGLPTSA